MLKSTKAIKIGDINKAWNKKTQTKRYRIETRYKNFQKITRRNLGIQE